MRTYHYGKTAAGIVHRILPSNTGTACDPDGILHTRLYSAGTSTRSRADWIAAGEVPCSACWPVPRGQEHADAAAVKPAREALQANAAARELELEVLDPTGLDGHTSTLEARIDAYSRMGLAPRPLSSHLLNAGVLR